MSNVIRVTESTFHAEVLESPLPVLLDFYGDYCPPCRQLAPVLAELAVEIAGRAKVAKVDVSAEEKLSREFGIDLIPTLIVFKNGQPTVRLVGLKSKQELLVALDL